MPWADVFANQVVLGDPNTPLVTRNDFVEWFNLPSPGTTEQARMDTALEIASGIVRSGRRVFTAITNDVVTIDGPGGCDLLLPKDRLPVRDVASVTNLAWGDTDPVSLAAADYDWSPSGLIRLHRDSTIGGWWTRRAGGIVVTYSHGYDPVPRAVAGIVLDLAKRLYDNPTGATVRNESLGDYSVSYDATTGGLLPHEEEILRQYEVVM